MSLDPTPFDRKPFGAEVGKINNGLKPAALSIKELSDYIGQGCTWSPSIFDGPRKLENWKSLQLLAIDIDEGDLSLEYIKSVCRFSQVNPCIIHESFSSSLRAKKWRVIFALDEPITNTSQAYSLLRGVNQIFGGDPAAAEPSRMLFGCTPNKMHLVEEVYNPIEGLPTFTPNTSPSSSSNKPYRSGKKLFHGGDLAIAALVIEDSKERLANPRKEGSRYMSLFLSAAKLAQLPIIDDDEAILTCLTEEVNRLIEAETPETPEQLSWGCWDKDVQQVIWAGIKWGRENPRC